jgi:hypothetical protein
LALLDFPTRQETAINDKYSHGIHPVTTGRHLDATNAATIILGPFVYISGNFHRVEGGD